MPALVISPYASKGYIDHQVLSSDAYLKFIERRFPPRPAARPAHRRAARFATERARERQDPGQPRQRLQLRTEAAPAVPPPASPSVQLTRLALLLLAAGALAGCGAALPGRKAPYPGPHGIHLIQHVVVIMEENRSFDSFFGTYPHADGIPMRRGAPTVCVPNGVGQCVRPFLDANGNDDSGGAHGPLAGKLDVNGATWTGSSGSPTGCSSAGVAGTRTARRARASATRTS